MTRGNVKIARVRVLTAFASVLLVFRSDAAATQREWIGAASGGVPPAATPAAWNSSANWQGGTIPTANTDLANFTTTGDLFVTMPDGLTVGAACNSHGSTGSYLHLIGTRITVDSTGWSGAGGTVQIAGGRLIAKKGSNGNDWGVYVYADVDVVKNLSGLWSVAGAIRVPVGCEITSSVGQQQWRGDWYADSADEARTNDFDIGYLNNSSSSMIFIGPSGAAARDSAGWSQSVGSSYLKYTGSSLGRITPGCTVTGDGIPDGTFLKRYFARQNVIQLSQSVTQTKSGGTLHFGDYHPATTGRITQLLANNDMAGMSFSAYTDSGLESFTILIGTLRANANTWATKTPMTTTFDGYLHPAKLIVSCTKDLCGTIQFKNGSDIVFKSPTAGVAGIACARAVKFVAPTSGYATRAAFTVEPGVDAVFSNIVEVADAATVTKRGSGSLRFDFTNTLQTVSAAFVVEEGVLELEPRAAAFTNSNLTVASGATARIDGTDVRLNALSLAEGATLDVRATVLSITNSVFAPGSVVDAAAGTTVDLSSYGTLPEGVILSGEGTYVVRTLDSFRAAVFGSNAVVRLATEGSARAFRETGKVEPEVVGCPAFWVDAAKNVTTNTFLWTNYNGSVTTYNNGVVRWGDCRDGETAYYATNDWSGLTTSTDCRNCPARTRNDEGMPSVEFYGLAYTGQSNRRYCWCGLVWNRPITNVCAVFSVTVRYSGGQAALGSTKRFAAMGSARYANDFMRGVMSDQGGGVGTAANRLLNNEAAACVRNGWIYVNGAAMAPTDSVTAGTYAILEYHPRAPYGRADAFAIQEHGGVTCSGCQYLLETIVYTNELTQVEREKVYAYLAKKYHNQDYTTVIGASRYEGEDGYSGNLCVTNGQYVPLSVGDTAFADRLTGTGTLAKKGAGSLYADLVAGTSLKVEDGTLVLHSAKQPADYDDLPERDAFIHWDAANTNSMTFLARNDTFTDGLLPASRSVTEVQRWYHARHGNDGFHPYGTSRKSDGRYRAGWIVDNGLNGKRIVDYGPLVTYNDSVNFERRVFHEFHYTDANVAYRATPVHSVFQVKETSGGGNWVLGDLHNNDNGGISRATTTTNYTAAILKAVGTTGVVGALLNGEEIDPTTVGYTGGWDHLSLHNVGNARDDAYKSDLFGANAPFTVSGGMKLAEMMVFTNMLTWAEARTIDAYLGGKWFNTVYPYATPAVAGDVAVSSGARLVIEGDRPLVAKSLVGSGTVSGSVTLVESAVIEVCVDALGNIEGPVVISGDLDLSKGGTVVLTGYVSQLKSGTYPLLTAATLASGKWTCVADGAKRSVKVRQSETTLYLSVSGCGGTIIVR